MKTSLALLLLAAPAGLFAQDAPDLKNGQAEFQRCTCCHGDHGEGAFGPDLAGRGLSHQQFVKAVRQPWGVMPSFPARIKSDTALRDIHAYLQSLPKAATLGAARFAPPTAPLGQQLFMNVIGCGQCHEPENKLGRMWLGEHAAQVDFEYFKTQIYRHGEKWPKGTMPDYRPKGAPEVVLREIYKWMVEDLGLRASIAGTLSAGERQGDETTYTLAVTNNGVKDVGLDAEGLTIFVRIPNGARVVKATVNGYDTVMPLATPGLAPMPPLPVRALDETGRVERPTPDLSRDVAVWRFATLAAGTRETFTLTLTGAPPTADVVPQFQGSMVYWDKPGRRLAGTPPIMVFRDLRLPDKGDAERIAPPHASAPTSP